MNRNRSQDVAALGIVTEQLTEANGFDAATFLCEVHEQEGQYRDGRSVHVYPRDCRVKPSARMTESGVRVRAGDTIRVLVPPTPGPDVVYTAIHVQCMAREPAPEMRSAGMPQRRAYSR